MPTDGHIVVLDKLTGLRGQDPATLEATLGAGIRLAEIGPVLEEVGQGMFNLPDIDRQTLAGAISTATHGTGLSLNTLSAYVSGTTPRHAVGQGDGARRSERAALVRRRAGLARRARLRHRSAHAQPGFVSVEEDHPVQPTEEVLQDFEAQARAHSHFEMFPLTHSKYASVLIIDETDEPIHNPQSPPDQPDPYDELMRALVHVPVAARGAMINAAVAAAPPSEPVVDVSYRILANVRNYRFNEMEYSVPLDAGAPCLLEILRTIDEKQIDVVFPLEYRYVAGDDLWLSMFSGGPRASISVHRDARFDYRPYFDIVEPIFWKYGGRPHWGKVHTLKHDQLVKLYPNFKDFLEMREALDPTGRMLNAHLRGLFGIAT